MGMGMGMGMDMGMDMGIGMGMGICIPGLKAAQEPTDPCMKNLKKNSSSSGNIRRRPMRGPGSSIMCARCICAIKWDTYKRTIGVERMRS